MVVAMVRSGGAKLVGLLMTFAVLSAGCQPATPPVPESSEQAAVEAENASDANDAVPIAGADEDLASQVQDEYVGLTHHRLDGNRVVNGYTDLSKITPIDVELDGVPVWVAAVPTESGVLWGVVLEDGRTQAVLVANGTVTEVPTKPEVLPAGMPPLLRWVDGTAHFIMPSGDFSPLSNAVPVGEELIGVDAEGDLIIEDADETTRLDVDALPDARVLVDDQNRVLLLSGPTDRYAHGVLGDKLEASSITLVEMEPEPRVLQVMSIPESRVVEGIAPIWADLDADGIREILVTLSDAVNGAQIVAYREDGSIAAEGPVIGQGNRWRHQIAVAPFGPQRQLELAAVLTPHIGGIVEFYALQDGRLDVVARLPGFTSHVLGSRNLDMAIAASPAEEGQAVLLTPSQDRSRIGAVRHGEAGAEVAWFIDIGGKIVTNLAAASLDDDQIGVAVGRSDGVLRIWQPD